MIVMITISLILENEIISIQLIRSLGAFVCFFLWIKVFYWARLFTNLAYYVKLVQDTIIDSQYFIFMVCLIILSFSSYFYVADQNLKDGDTMIKEYYGKGSDLLNSVVSVYMLGALGDFESDSYSQG